MGDDQMTVVALDFFRERFEVDRGGEGRTVKAERGRAIRTFRKPSKLSLSLDCTVPPMVALVSLIYITYCIS